MFCEPYRKKLSEVVACGGDQPAELLAHIEECTACRQVFAAERSLFESIEAQLRISANADVPVSFVRRVRAEVSIMPPSVGWRRPAAALVTASVGLAFVWWLGLQQTGKQRVMRDQAGESTSAQARSEPQLKPPEITRDSTQALKRPRIVLTSARPGKASFPEVIIAADERVGLAKYEKVLRSRLEEKQFVADGQASDVLEIKPLEIAEMDLKQVPIQPLVASEAN